MSCFGAIAAMLVGIAAVFSGGRIAVAATDPIVVSPLDTAGPALLAAPTPAPPPTSPAVKSEPIGNPLWAVPFSTLSTIRERPIFSPSRRAPIPIVASPVVEPPKSAPPAPAAEPERPQLTLVGAIASESDGFAIFLDNTNKTVVRLRTGENYSGWVLHSVKGREATLQRDADIAVFELPAPSDAPPPTQAMPAANQFMVPGRVPLPPLATAPNTVPMTQKGELVVPGPGQSFAPYIPRHTPKDGSHDGL